jgi:hypothetical protein
MKGFNSLKARLTLAGIAGGAIINFMSHAASIAWTNTADGNWSVAVNWSPNSVPGANDLAFITNNGTYSVALDTSPAVAGLTLGGASGTQTLSMNGQTLSLNGPLTVNPNGSYTLDSGGLVGTTNALLTGTLNWAGGSSSGVLTLSAGSTLNVTTANNHELANCTFTNNGTVAWTNGSIGGGGAGTAIYNNGVWDSQGDLSLNDEYGGNTVFNNYGTFRKSAGVSGSQTSIQGGVQFNQLSGEVDVQTGTLALQGGGNFDGGFVTTNQSGVMTLAGGNFTINGAVTGSNTVENAGNLTGTNVIRGQLIWSGGAWSGASSVTVTTNSTVFLAGGVSSMYLYSCLVTNYGTVVWLSGYPNGGSVPGTLIYNYGLWDCQCDNIFLDSGGGNNTAFNNYGTFRKSAGVSGSQTTMQGGVQFNQLGGEADVQTGTLALQGGGNFDGGFVTTNQSGVMILSAGNFNFNGAATSSNTVENTGNLTGNNVIRGQFTWSGGTWSGASSVTVATNSAVFLAGGVSSMYLYSCLVTNYGTVVWLSGYPNGGSVPGTLVYNYGLWDCQCDNIFLDSGGGDNTVFNNYGTLRKSAGSDASQTTLPAGVTLNNFGGIDAQAGWLAVQGGLNLTNSTINFGISGPGNYGKLNVSGAAALSGTVSVNLNNGYVPIGGNAFTNLYYGSFTGIFTNTLLPFADAWNTNYTPTYLVFNVLNARPVLNPLPTNNFTVNELTTLAVTNPAVDPNIPPLTLTYSLVGGSNGMAITPATGVFTWTPPQTNSPSTNTVWVVVADNGVPELSATNTFRVIVREVNVPPALPTIATQIVSALTLLTVTNTATNANIHSTISGYNLVNAPTNVAISAGGIITWSPSLAQNSSTNLITTIVTNSNPYDLVNPHLTTTNTFTVFVGPTNLAPSLPTVATQIVNELTLLTVTNTATNANLQATIIGYRLVSPPNKMAISTNGIITWTPAQNQSPATNRITTVVTNSDLFDPVHPQLTSTNIFTVIVKEVNVAPSLPTVATQIINELTQLSVTNAATNADIHATISGYQLVTPPSNMVVHASGVINWTPAQVQSPGTNLITTIVTNSDPYDLVNPHLTSTNIFTVIVKEVNVAPSLPAVSNQSITLLQLLTVTNTATEPNIHSTNTGYFLTAAPAGMTINASGLIAWTPAVNQTLTTNTVTTVVTNVNPYDLVNPHLSATNSFKVIALPNTGVTNLMYQVNGGTSFNFSWPVDHTGWRLQVQTNSLADGLGTNWAAVSGSSGTNQITVQIAHTNPVVMFRLIYP